MIRRDAGAVSPYTATLFACFASATRINAADTGTYAPAGGGVAGSLTRTSELTTVRDTHTRRVNARLLVAGPPTETLTFLIAATTTNGFTFIIGADSTTAVPIYSAGLMAISAWGIRIDIECPALTHGTIIRSSAGTARTAETPGATRPRRGMTYLVRSTDDRHAGPAVTGILA